MIDLVLIIVRKQLSKEGKLMISSRINLYVHTTTKKKQINILYTTLLPPVLDHSADYTNYGNSLPRPCLPPSNLSATAWGKTDQKFLPGKVTMHSPAPRCDSLKVRPMALSERKRVHWQLKTGLRRGTCIAELKKNNNNNSDFCSR